MVRVGAHGFHPVLRMRFQQKLQVAAPVLQVAADLLGAEAGTFCALVVGVAFQVEQADAGVLRFVQVCDGLFQLL
jgi:hypothetical protein